jgi:prephenate dehydratase
MKQKVGDRQGSKVSIQGYEGSFHQVAARSFFGEDVEVIPCATFREVIRVASTKELSTGGVMAIENSIAGSILPNYSLLQNANLKVTGEVYLQIEQHLLVNPGVKLEDIKEVHSHPMAILQCMDYLDKYHWKLVETEDTALSAKLLHQYRNKYTAAIASKLAADLFHLDIITPNIHTMSNNYTRFLILERAEDAVWVENANKASINFYTDHSKGILAKVLTAIANADINLSKLQSFPIPGSDFQYNFHADMEFESMEQFNQVISIMESLTEGLNVYGVYRNGMIKSSTHVIN